MLSRGRGGGGTHAFSQKYDAHTELFHDVNLSVHLVPLATDGSISSDVSPDEGTLVVFSPPAREGSRVGNKSTLSSTSEPSSDHASDKAKRKDTARLLFGGGFVFLGCWTRYPARCG